VLTPRLDQARVWLAVNRAKQSLTITHRVDPCFHNETETQDFSSAMLSSWKRYAYFPRDPDRIDPIGRDNESLRYW
jgi:hypothetical protein